MGRDTGIIIRGHVDIPFYVRVIDRFGDKKYEVYETEICYWRGDYSMVERIRKELKIPYGEREFDLLAEDADKIAHILALYWTGRVPITNSRYSRWYLFRDYLNLKWLSRLLSNRPIEVIFYDSF